MNPVVIFDLVALLAALVALIILLTCWKRALSFDARILLAGLLTVTIFHGFCNVLQWSGITAVLDPFEDFVGIFEPLLWGFFLYAFLKATLIQDAQESTERYRSLYSSMNEGMALHEIIYDESGEAADYRILDVNPAYESILGIRKEDAIGAKASELYGTGKAPYLETYAKVTASGKPASFESYFEAMAKWFKISAFSPADRKFVTLFADITEHKQAEEALQEKSYIIQSSSSVIAMADLDGKMTYVNPSFLRVWGFEDDGDVLGRPFPEFWVVEERLGEITDALHRKGRWSDEIQARRKDGSLFDVQVSAAMVFDNQNNPLSFTSTSIDITERKQAEDELAEHREHLEELVIERTLSLKENQKALVNIVEDLNMTTKELKNANLRLQELDRLKSMFIASTSHELRTPLNSIIGFTSVLLEGWSGELTPEQKGQLQIVNTSGKHLLSLINDIIDISKIEAGKLEIYMEEFSLRDVVDEAVSVIRIDVENKRLNLTVDVPEVTMTTDRRRLLQCIINLLSNAVKFTEKGSITLTAKTINNELNISIADTGIGIKREDMQKLFTPFTRLESPLTQKTSGTGLGLYLTKKLAEGVLGGTVDMGSEYGKGSTFALHIPVKQEVRK